MSDPDAPMVLLIARPSEAIHAIEATLGGTGLQVTSVADREQALELMARAPIHLCLVDLTAADAVRTIRAIHASRPGLVVLGMANGDRPEVTSQALQAGCADVIAQPLEAADLAVVEANAREATPLPPNTVPAGDDNGPIELVGTSTSMRQLNEIINHAAAARCHVLLMAERGFDLEAVAREIHVRSRRDAARFFALDCGHPDPQALETALFGARDTGNGRDADDLEVVGPESLLLDSCGGTLFLGGIAELPASLQVRLARVARDRELRVAESPVVGDTSAARVAGKAAAGGNGNGRSVPFDGRLMTAATPALDGDVEDGRFRSDLYRRLSVLRLSIPPLRERPDDVPALVTRLTRTLCAAGGLPPRRFTNGALTVLAALPWPGNIDELSSVLARVLATPGPSVIDLEGLLIHVRFDGGAPRVTPNGPLSVARACFEREYIAAVLQRHRWSMADAAKALGIQRPNLYRKTRQLGITRNKPLP